MLQIESTKFRTCAEVREAIQDACSVKPHLARFYTLGDSEEGRPIDAVVLGHGKRNVSLIAGAHADEPAGPETLRHLIIDGLKEDSTLTPWLKDFTFVIIPHINPDGEARNQTWIKEWPDFESYLQNVFRELPGRDVEFGFPHMRVENKLVSEFLKDFAPFEVHTSLHGMGVADGAMLLIEKHWIERTKDLQKKYADILKSARLQLHDHDRKGDKGFQYIGPGFTTTPEGQAMQAYFRSIGDDETANRFHLSSMEFVRTLGGDPLCLVTEIPLFYIQKQILHPQPGVPTAHLEFRKIVPDLRQKLSQHQSIQKDIAEFNIKHLPLDLLVHLQFQAIKLGLETILI